MNRCCEPHLSFEVLTGDLVSVSLFDYSHLNSYEYFSWLHDIEVLKTLILPEYINEPVKIEDLQKYCKRLWASESDIFLALTDVFDDIFIGTSRISKLNQYAGTADVGIMIGDRSFWGRGYATEALRMICNHLFTKVRLRKLTAGAMANNHAMLSVFEKLGFVVEGKLRLQDRLDDNYIDHFLLGCFREEFK